MKKSSLLAVIITVIAFTMSSSCDDDGGGNSDTINNTSNNTNNTVNLTRENVLRACLMRDGCNILPLGYVSQCLENYDEQAVHLRQDIWSKIYSCVLTATNCTEIRACFGNGEPPQSCDVNTSAGHCDGDTAYVCDAFDNTLYAYDCSASGMTCVQGADGIPHCTKSECNPATSTPECDGDIMTVCDANGYEDITDCAQKDLNCIMVQTRSGENVPACLEPGEQCKPDEFEDSCDGNTLVVCLYGATSRIDCTKLAGQKRCQQDDTGARCVAQGTECEVQDETCLDDFVARLCRDGYIMDVDCRDLGFRRCVGQGPAKIGAHCTNN